MYSYQLKSYIINVSNLIYKKYFLGQSNIPVRFLRKLSSSSIISHFFQNIGLLFGSGMMVALTQQCQCKCKHCGVVSSDVENDKKQLTTEDIIKLIDEAKNLGISRIFYFGGEPLLVKDLFYLIKYANQKRISLIMDTNGYLLKEDIIIELKKAGLDKINISIDSPDEHVHDSLRGVDGIYKKAMNGVALCQKYNVKCCISTYATKDNLRNGELKRLVDMAKKMNVEMRILSVILCGRLLKENNMRLDMEDINILKSLLDKKSIYWESEMADSKDAQFSCAAAQKRLFYVSVFGDIQPCCFLPVSFGNIRQESLKSIIKKMQSSEMYDWFGKNKSIDCPMNNSDFRNKYLN